MTLLREGIPLYSTCCVSAEEASQPKPEQLLFFAALQGERGQGYAQSLTQQETNYRRVPVPAGEQLRVHEIHVRVYPGSHGLDWSAFFFLRFPSLDLELGSLDVFPRRYTRGIRLPDPFRVVCKYTTVPKSVFPVYQQQFFVRVTLICNHYEGT